MTDAPTTPKPPTKLGAEKLTPKEQRRRFEELRVRPGATKVQGRSLRQP